MRQVKTMADTDTVGQGKTKNGVTFVAVTLCLPKGGWLYYPRLHVLFELYMGCVYGQSQGYVTGVGLWAHPWCWGRTREMERGRRIEYPIQCQYTHLYKPSMRCVANQGLFNAVITWFIGRLDKNFRKWQATVIRITMYLFNKKCLQRNGW